MILLATRALPSVRKMREEIGPVIGRLLTPRHLGGIAATIESGIPWAADNDGFGGVHVGRFLKMLGTLASQAKEAGRIRHGCLFVTAPDVYADGRATMTEFMRWAPIIREAGLPVAYVLQDGGAVPWAMIDALFLGGSTRYKLSANAGRWASEAKARGIWLHVGRVNSLRRLEYAQSIGADSVDGSKWARWQDTHLHQLRSLPFRQESLRPQGNGRIPG